MDLHPAKGEVAVGCSAPGRDRNAQLSAQIAAGNRASLSLDLVWRSACQHLAPALPRARPEVDNVIRSPDCLRVVLNHDHAVVLVPELAQGGQQTRGIARVEADRGLVKDVQDAGQAGSELGAQADALGFSSRQRRQRPVQPHIVEADIAQRLESATDRLTHRRRNRGRLTGKGQAPKKIERLGNRQSAQLGNIAILKPHASTLGLEPRTGAPPTPLSGRFFRPRLCPGGLPAQPVALRAGALGAVGRKEGRRQIGIAEAARRTAQRLGKQVLVGGPVRPGVTDFDHIAAVAQRGFDGVGQPPADPAFDNQTVNNKIKLGRNGYNIGQLIGPVRDPHTNKTRPTEFLHGQLKLRPARNADGRHDLKPAALGQGQHTVNDLGHAVTGERPVAAETIGSADPGVQQTHIIGKLGDRTDCRAGRAGQNARLDRHGRGQTADGVNLGFGALVKKLTGIGRQRFNIAAASFGVQHVKGQGRFTRAGHAGDDHQPVAGNVNTDVLEIVLAGTPDADCFHGPKEAQFCRQG